MTARCSNTQVQRSNGTVILSLLPTGAKHLRESSHEWFRIRDSAGETPGHIMFAWVCLSMGVVIAFLTPSLSLRTVAFHEFLEGGPAQAWQYIYNLHARANLALIGRGCWLPPGESRARAGREPGGAGRGPGERRARAGRGSGEGRARNRETERLRDGATE